jgi:hypothetical protein
LGSKARKPLKFTATRAWTPQDDVWEEAGRRWEVEALPTLRAAADRWTAGLAILLGGSGIGILLGGPEKLAVIAFPYEGWAKAALFGAAALAAFALLMALLAAGATTKTLFLISGPALRRANRAAVPKAAMRYAISRWAAAIALALLLGSASLLFYAPRDSTNGTSTHESATTSQDRKGGP